MTRARTSAVVLLAAATALAAALHYGKASGVAVFVTSGAALGGLAWLLSFLTEELGKRLGPGPTGLLQSTLGNLPEFFIVVFALAQGQLVVAQTSILGSLFANALLVLGLVLVVGARAADDGIMRFRRRLPNDTATLLLVASFVIAIVGLSIASDDRASHHVRAISTIAAIALLAVYATWLVSYLRAESALEPALRERPLLSLGPTLVLLAGAAVGAAFASEWFVGAVDPAVRSLGISKAFAGLVIVAIAGNAVEHVVGVVLAYRSQPDLAISVVKNSVSQVAAFLLPLLVLVSLLFTTQLTFALAPVYVGALFLTALVVWQITGDGEATAFEGAALIAMFAMVATYAWFA